MILRRIIWVLSALILSLGTSALAQQPEIPSRPDAPQAGQQRRMGREGRRREHVLGLMQQLNLTDAQRQQLRDIHQLQFEALKSQRLELFNLREKRLAGTFTDEDAARARALRQQIHEAKRGTHTDVQGILTAEQKAQIEELRKARKARHEEMRLRRQQLRRENPQ